MDSSYLLEVFVINDVYRHVKSPGIAGEFSLFSITRVHLQIFNPYISTEITFELKIFII